MSCRNTAGGRAASACASALFPGSSHKIPRIMHELKNADKEMFPNAPQPSKEKTVEVLDRLAYLVRNDPNIPLSRKQKAFEKINSAINEVLVDEVIPDAATLTAWRDLPFALETEKISSRLKEAYGRIEAVENAAKNGELMTSLPYHRRFKNFKETTVNATEDLFKARPSRLTLEEAENVFKDWLSKVSASYNLPSPNFVWDADAIDGGGGYYSPDDQTIALSHVSVTTLLHEFRHHMQWQGIDTMVSEDKEEDARAWSLSLYYTVRPRLFERLVQEQRIYHISPQELG